MVYSSYLNILKISKDIEILLKRYFIKESSMCWELNIKVQLISGRKKLMPNIMIVFYAGSSFWKAPQRLQEMMDKSKSMENIIMIGNTFL